MKLQITLTTTDTEKEAKELAEKLVTEHLAACVQISAPVQSVYRWEGTVHSDTEWQLWIKTTEERREELTAFLTREHSYEEPEILTLPVTHVSERYGEWVQQETAPPAT